MIWNVASLGILGVSGIAINWIIARFIDASALGIFNQVFAAYILLSQFSVGGVHFSVLKHISYHQDDHALNSRIASNGLILSFLLSLGFALMAYLLRQPVGALLKSPGVAEGMGYMAPGLIGFSLNKVLLNVLNGRNSMRAYAVFQALRYVLILIGVILVVLMDLPKPYLPGTLTFAETLLLLVLAPYVHFSGTPFRFSELERFWMKEHITFGLKGFLSGALMEINTRIDVLIIGYYMSDTRVGIYSFAAILAEGFSQLHMVLRRNVDPLIGKSFADQDTRRIENYAVKLRKVVYPGMLLLAGVAIALYPLGLKWFVGDPAYDPSWAVFAILMAGVFVISGFKPFIGLLLQRGRPELHTLLVFLMVCVNTAGNLALIPILGLNGAALATVVAWIVESGLLIYFSNRFCDVNLLRITRRP